MPDLKVKAASLASSLAASPHPAIVIYLLPVPHRALDRLLIRKCAAEGTLELTEEERPCGYTGQDWTDQFIGWRTRATPPEISGECSS